MSAAEKKTPAKKTLERELFLVLTDPDTTLSDSARRVIRHVCNQLHALASVPQGVAEDMRDLRATAARAPYVTEQDIQDIARMDVADLRRRALVARDWHGHFSHCLDGIPEIACMPGAAPDGCWSHKEVRSVVSQLIARPVAAAEQPAANAGVAVPAGWVIERKGDDIFITAPEGTHGAIAMAKDARSVPERLLHALALDLLAAAPAAPVAPAAFTQLERWLNPDHIRLHAGEMTPQEMRTTLAVLRAVFAEAARAAPVAREPLTETQLESVPVEVLKAWATLRHTPWPFSPCNVRQTHALCAWVQSAHGIVDKLATGAKGEAS